MATQCNWHHNKEGEACTDPCAAGNVTCWGFCRGPGFGSPEKSQLPKCAYRKSMDFSHCDRLREELQMSGQIACQECMTPCHEPSFWEDCHSSRQGDCNNLDNLFCESCNNDFMDGNCTCCLNHEGHYDPWRCQIQQRCQENINVECQAQSAAHEGPPRTGYRRDMGGPVCRSAADGAIATHIGWR